MKSLSFGHDLVNALRKYGMEYHMVTPLERQTFDPYGLIQANLSKHNQNRVGQQCPLTKGFGTSEEWLNWYENTLLPRLQSPAHQLYWDINRSYSSKFGPQGGSIYLPDAVEILSKYYAKITSRKHEVLDRGLKALIRQIKEVVRRVGYLAEYPSDGDHVTGTWAGIPTGSRKGEYRAETEMCSPHLQHIVPSVVGFRKARNAIRAIFQDGTPNVRQTAGMATAVLKWLRKYMPQYFGAWLHPREVVNPIATKHVERRGIGVEYDYEKCDQHFTKKVTLRYVIPVLAEIMGPQSGEFISFAALIEEYFDAALYLGDVMVTGEHNLFSGQTITQLIETIFDIVLQLGVVEMLGLTETLHLAVGDDQALLLPRRFEKAIQEVVDAGVEASITAGLPMNKDKCHIADGHVSFCKRSYYPGGIRECGVLIGAYPGVLTLNSIVNPEFSASTLGESLCATLQRMDNLYGSPEFSPMVTAIGSRIDKGINYTSVDIASVNRKDWWQKLYHEPWNPESSRSFKLLSAQHLI